MTIHGPIMDQFVGERVDQGLILDPIAGPDRSQGWVGAGRFRPLWSVGLDELDGQSAGLGVAGEPAVECP
jgi:hypothetical protein